MSELPVLEAALTEAARRRFDRPWWRRPVARRTRRVLSGLAGAAVVSAAVVLVVTLAGGSGPSGSDERPAGPRSQWTTTVDRAAGYAIRLPPGWSLATRSLTPQLSDPRERLSAATFPLRFRRSPCAHMPAGALRTMGSRDGFLTILERGRGSPAAEFPPRPPHFADGARPQAGGDLETCLHGRPRLTEYWLPFSDAGRHFYAMVVLGPDAPSAVRAQAFAVLDRLRFDRRVRPGWAASG